MLVYLPSAYKELSRRRVGELSFSCVLFVLNFYAYLLGKYFKVLHSFSDTSACCLVFFVIELDSVCFKFVDEFLYFYIFFHSESVVLELNK